MPFLPPEQPTIVEPGPGRHRRPCSGSHLARTFDALNWSALWRGRGVSALTVAWENAAVWTTSPIGVDSTLRVPLRVTTAAHAVAVRFAYQATRRPTYSEILEFSAGVYVEATLRDGTGVALDGVPSMTWCLDDGTLPMPAGRGNERYPVGEASTGDLLDPALAAFPTPPRLLNVDGLLYSDVPLTLELAARNVRLISVWTLEVPVDLL